MHHSATQSSTNFSFSIPTILLIGVFTSYISVITPAFASPVDDFYIQQAINRYFALPTDAISLSLAGVPRAVCVGPQCIYFNPAGSSSVTKLSLAGSLGIDELRGEEFLEENEIEQQQYEGYLSLSIPLGVITSSDSNREFPQYGTLSLGYSRYQGETDDSINTTPDGHRRSVSYGLAVTEAVSLGYAFHFYDDQLRSDLADLHSHARFLHVLGTQYKVSDRTILAGVFQYGLGQSDTEDFEQRSDGLSRPRQLSVALAVKHQVGSLILYAGQDYSRLHSEGNLEDISSSSVVIGSNESGYTLTSRLGLEAPDISRFALRAGIHHQWAEYTFERSDLSLLTGNYSGLGYSAGVGYSFDGTPGTGKDLRIDYGVEYSRIGKGFTAHIFSIVVPIA